MMELIQSLKTIILLISIATVVHAASVPVVRDLDGSIIRSAKISKNNQHFDISITNKKFILDLNKYKTNGPIIISINDAISWGGNVPSTKLIYFPSRAFSYPIDNSFFSKDKTPFLTGSSKAVEPVPSKDKINTGEETKPQGTNPVSVQIDASKIPIDTITVETQRSYISLQSNTPDHAIPLSRSNIRESSIEVMKTSHLDTIRLPNILFKKNQSDLGSKSLSAILKTRYLFSQNYTHIIVKGHTDSSGKPDYNKQLSEKRGATVRDLIIKEFKVPADKIEIQGLADTEPEADNATEKGREMNRRVTIGIIRE